MRKNKSIIGVFLLALSLCLAQALWAGEPMARGYGSKSIIGKVRMIMPSSAITKSKITVLDEKGYSTTFVVKPLTTIHDSSGKLLSLTEVKYGEDAQINYMVNSKEGVKEAVAIRILKKEAPKEALKQRSEPKKGYIK